VVELDELRDRANITVSGVVLVAVIEARADTTNARATVSGVVLAAVIVAVASRAIAKTTVSVVVLTAVELLGCSCQFSCDWQ